MKTRNFWITLMTVAVLAVFFASCSKDAATTGEDEALVEKSGVVPGTCTTCDFTGVLSDAEKADLMWMREEEKMARDVYTYFYTKYKVLVFKNIAASENAHMSAILYLINGYKLTDPALAEAGKFSEPKIQELYNSLIAKGEVSLTEAYKVGVDIETVDIADLVKALKETDKTNITRTYTNLQNASQIHLKTFKAALTRLGITYP